MKLDIAKAAITLEGVLSGSAALELIAELERLTGITDDAYTRGHEQGMRDAAQLAASLFFNKSYRSVGRTASEAILSAIPSTPKGCEWPEIPLMNEWVTPECSGGCSLSRIEFRFCPYCGNPIKVQQWQLNKK